MRGRRGSSAIYVQAFDCYISVLRHLRAQRHLWLVDEVTETRNELLQGLDRLAVETCEFLASAAGSVPRLNRQRCRDLQWAIEQLGDIGQPVFDTFEELMLQLLRSMPKWWVRSWWLTRGSLDDLRASRGWSDARGGARPFYDQLTRRAELRKQQNGRRISLGSLLAPSAVRRNAPGEGAFTLPC